MKKLNAIIAVTVIILGLAACGRRNDTGTTNNNDMTILPTDIPTMETNIPDPDVDTKMPMYTEGTENVTPTFDNSDRTDRNR